MIDSCRWSHVAEIHISLCRSLFSLMKQIEEVKNMFLIDFLWRLRERLENVSSFQPPRRVVVVDLFQVGLSVLTIHEHGDFNQNRVWFSWIFHSKTPIEMICSSSTISFNISIIWRKSFSKTSFSIDQIRAEICLTRNLTGLESLSHSSRARDLCVPVACRYELLLCSQFLICS